MPEPRGRAPGQPSTDGPSLRIAGVSGGVPAGAHTGSCALDDASALAAIVAAAGAGDQHAWRRLVRAYTPRVFAMVRSRVRDPELAEELTQSVFATVAGRLGTDAGYNEQGRFEPWLFRVTMNRVRDEARRRRRRAVLQDRIAAEPRFAETAAAADSETDSPAALPAELDRLRDAMDNLNDKDREVIELRHHAQMSFKQMAAMLDEPVGTLLARHHRALRKLRELIETAALPTNGPGKTDATEIAT